jgi:diamine N-acetyltransferase
LAVHRTQENYVANNATSIAQAHFEPKAWFRAVYADETPVGFVMLFIDVEKAEYYVWRFMIDVRYQGKGYGKQALQLLINHIRDTYPLAARITLSYVPGNVEAQKLYASAGFVETGKEEDGEREMELIIRPELLPPPAATS